MVGLINKEDIYDIADAIREKTQTEDTFKPSEMGELIRSIRVIPENSYQLNSIAQTPLATFDADALPMPSLKVGIEPQQDLHGQDHPWVGGAGKNKANPDLLLNGYTSPSNRKYDDTTMAKTQFVKTEGLSTITISATNGNRCYVCYYNDIPNVGDETSTNVMQVATSLPQTITVDSSYTYVAIQVSYNPSGANVSNVQVESGSTATSYAPYSNICPISGWTEEVITRTGKNLWGGEKLADDIVAKVPQATKDTTNKTVTYSAGYVSGKVLFDNFKPNTIYTIFMMTSSASNNVMVRYTDGTTEYINKDSITVTQANKSIECIIGIWSTGATVLKYDECGVFEGVLTAQDFEPYADTTYTIDLDGTRYGGTLDVVSGELVVTDGYIASYNGETLPSTWISDRDVYAEGSTPTTGAEVCYELATPLTIQLTPTQVNSLLGTNNLWADTGDILEGEYFKAL